MMRYFLLVALLLCACAPKIPQAPDCPVMYVLLPGNYVIDLAAGARVVVDPAVQDIAVFCTLKEAHATLNEVDKLKEWGIYIVGGEFADVAEVTSQGDYRLTRPVEVLDWVSLEGSNGSLQTGSGSK